MLGYRCVPARRTSFGTPGLTGLGPGRPVSTGLGCENLAGPVEDPGAGRGAGRSGECGPGTWWRGARHRSLVAGSGLGGVRPPGAAARWRESGPSAQGGTGRACGPGGGRRARGQVQAWARSGPSGSPQADPDAHRLGLVGASLPAPRPPTRTPSHSHPVPPAPRRNRTPSRPHPVPPAPRRRMGRR